jgi:hypothetical protein
MAVQFCLTIMTGNVTLYASIFNMVIDQNCASDSLASCLISLYAATASLFRNPGRGAYSFRCRFHE